MNPIHAWLVANPIARELIFGALFVVVAYYVTPLLATTKRFLAIPPQRLSVRILKARLSYAEANLENFYRLHDNLPYFIFKTCLTILTAIFAATVLVVGVEFSMSMAIVAHLRPEAGHTKVSRFLVRYCFTPYSFVLFFFTARNLLSLAGAVVPGRYFERYLKAKRNHLKVNLLDKGISE